VGEQGHDPARHRDELVRVHVPRVI
jgi:hypothetical protein